LEIKLTLVYTDSSISYGGGSSI